uniref:Peregrinol diphosphate synthase TPS1, chloroplastic n=1 Tax=Vitex agnus-castus TaxID=54477 RepID=TPS1_VITAC|nr:RecName: Full=Peregrinol diphosphate synthase TPS1, chloroplastic; AltName: Full=Terpene synthase 1; Short=VacTPS1; Flags: Precursor [Vitex agnus-castus]AUT77120.1 peregrinol diphosphate synthase [Vitex agnus-castus]
MASLSTPNINNTTFVNSKTQLPAVKVHLQKCYVGPWLNRGSKHMFTNYQFGHRQISKVAKYQASPDVVQVCDKVEHSTAQSFELVDKKIEDNIRYVKELLNSIDDGHISVSAYDTAWFALIRDLDGRDCPQFPSTIEWIADNQLADGSWGDEDFYSAYDRLINTLACVLALRTWNVHPEKSEKGISYIKENLHELEDAEAENMTCAFELLFPVLLKRAENLGINEIPYDAPIIKEIYNIRDTKLTRIPLEVLHERSTSILYGMEGLENLDLDWQKLMKLQTPEGSFLTSPAATAFAFMYTKDENCLKYIKYILDKFNGAAVDVYPVDLFARLWAVDRLQRLGISRFFESEIKDCLSYVHRFWTEKGIFSGRHALFHDLDDTSMGFRLLRQHGYDMDPNVFKHFQKDGRFHCLGGDMSDSLTVTYNLYRASQTQFPGEEILEEARNFCYNFLQDRAARNQLVDKWVISKHLADEMRTGLQLPWYASLPRVEARYYLQHYAGSGDVWLGKNFFRMEDISNDKYKEIAKLDFSRCQAQHQFEWTYMQGWYESSNVQEFGISRKDLLVAYFLAAATIFERERTKERIVWAKSHIVSRMIKSFFTNETTSLEEKVALLTGFEDNINGLHKITSAKREHEHVDILLATLHQLLGEFDEYASHQLKNAWRVWLTKLEQGEAGAEAELLVTTLNICAGHDIAFKEDILSQNEYKTLSNLTNKICQQLTQIQNKKVMETNDSNSIQDKEIEHDMQALVKSVLEEAVGIDRNIKQTFLSVAKTYYYGAYIAAETIDVHIFKVLFEPVI